MGRPLAVWTIGHSNRPFEAFLGLLMAHGIECVADIRTVPGSAKFPQFDRENLERELKAAGIGYRHLALLGGLRKPKRESVNTGWRLDSFRGYADYTATAEFERGVAELLDNARAMRTAAMCAEAVPWRCHRNLLADALMVRGITVLHILSGRRADPHRMTPFARVEGTQITYPGALDRGEKDQ